MRFENIDGFDLHYDPIRSTWWDTIYRFDLDPIHPLTFVDSFGCRLQPNRVYCTNLGSVPRFPPFIRALVPKDRFPAGFAMHDSGYAFGGMWVNGAFVSMTRKQVDDYLYYMMLSDPHPASRTTAWIVWTHVRAYGFVSWKKGDVCKESINPFGTGGILRPA